MRQITIGNNDSNQRLDKFLIRYMQQAPKNLIYKMLRKKNIVLNGKRAEGSEKLMEEDVVTFYMSDETLDELGKKITENIDDIINIGWNFKVLYEDDNILLVDKPVGVLSQKAEKDDISLNEMIHAYLIAENRIDISVMERFTPAVCNRLDRNTSGIVTAGKSLRGSQELTRLFRERRVEKYYYSIVIGHFKEKMQIKARIFKDTKKNIVRVVPEPDAVATDAGVASVANATTTDIGTNCGDIETIEAIYEPIKVFDKFTYLQVRLITGKPHQIRTHLAYLGYHIIGDFKYGKRAVNQKLKDKYGLNYQLLHAGRLVFPKMTGEFKGISNMCVTSELPEIFTNILNDIEKGVVK